MAQLHPKRPGRPGPPVRLGAFFRARDLDRGGASRRDLAVWLRRKEVEQVDRGLYRRRAAPVTEHETMVEVAARLPEAVICLISALEFHDIGTQNPRAIWLAVERKARKPRLPNTRVRVLWFSTRMMRYGVHTHDLGGVPVRVTSPARTVVDCFRYRNKVGLDVAIEALRDVLRSRKATPAELMRAAEVCRARTLLLPYLEALLS